MIVPASGDVMRFLSSNEAVWFIMWFWCCIVKKIPPPQDIWLLGDNQKLENKVFDIEELLTEIFRHKQMKWWLWIFYTWFPFKDPYWVLCKCTCISFAPSASDDRLPVESLDSRAPHPQKATRSSSPASQAGRAALGKPEGALSTLTDVTFTTSPLHLPNQNQVGYSQSLIYANLY